MNWINLRTEYTFGAVFAPTKDIVKKIKNSKAKKAGISDFCSTWSHVPFQRECSKNGISPVFGVRLPVVERLDIRGKRLPFDVMSFIALTDSGLQFIYRMVSTTYDQFYYQPRITYKQLNDIPEKHVAIIATYSPRFDQIKRHIYLSLSPSTPIAIRNKDFDNDKINWIACCDNFYIDKDQKEIYEGFADERKLERRTTPQHILTKKEWSKHLVDVDSKIKKKALKNLDKLLKKANAKLTIAPMVKYPKKVDIRELCKKGAKKNQIDLSNKKYSERLEKELSLIQEKDFTDYFLVVWDLIKFAKKHMLVGPARGSSAGSLVCYLLGITEVDPLKHNLIFERFIDINRKDLPDIDIDFQDDKRQLINKYLFKKYGKRNIAQLGNLSTLKPKSALTRYSKNLGIGIFELEEFKESIIERASGDERANKCIEDAFNDSEIGKETLSLYPELKPVKDIEGHVSHTSVHAAGILVSNEPITNFCGINTRNNQNIAMIDKDFAEDLNLLKIDALGLRTLTILAECCERIGKDSKWLYSLPLDDKKTFKLLNKQRLEGIFQFEGEAIRKLSKRMPIENIEDISALVSICRPGPLTVGAANSFVKRRSGKSKVTYPIQNKTIKNITKNTMGLVIYQEQVMDILRLFGGLPWNEVSILRKAMAKSKGDESFLEYKDKFIRSAKRKHKVKKKQAEKVWNTIKAMGQYSFNKSHAISYSLITYYTAYLKAHYPLELIVSSLNHIKDDDSALKLLRDAKENEGIEHVYFDPKRSNLTWTIHKKKLIASLTTIDGIGIQNARKIVALRKENKPYPAGINKHIKECKTSFKYLYPAKEIYGDYYQYPEKFGIHNTDIVEIGEMINNNDEQEYCFLGKMKNKIIRDLNEPKLVKKRNGQIINQSNTTFLTLKIEDDTGIVFCNIWSDDFDDIGREIAELGKIDKDWYLIYGLYNPEFQSVNIINIERITRKP